ncbi:MAG: hypothetical protein ACI4IE_02910 [Eubacterium sp.]
MKLVYKKPLIFPLWARFSNKNAGKKYYDITDNGVCFECKDELLPHFNHIEMTGFQSSSIISYNIDEKRRLKLYIFSVYPQIRVIPNETRGGLTCRFKSIDAGVAGCNKITEKVNFDGTLNFFEKCGDLKIEHCFSTARNEKFLIEKIKIKNNSNQAKRVYLKNNNTPRNIKKYNLVENIEVTLSAKIFDMSNGNKLMCNKIDFEIAPNSTKEFIVAYGVGDISIKQAVCELDARYDFIKSISEKPKITTPDRNVNRMLEFSKIRLCESIFETKNGLMHSPGGGNFYGALWTNDQCEYANPLFAYLGYKTAQEQSVNCYRLYSKFADESKAIPTSIIACGDDIWNGAGDRGDSSMYLYGLARYLLSTGDKKLANELLESIGKASLYVIKNITDDGIVKSDSDELENRFESGSANLSTSCITYDAFISLHYLYKDLGDNENAERFINLANTIKNGIEKYFGANVEGYNTYRYCEEEKNLRSWICLPLTMGIDNRKDDTVKALMSEKLYRNGAVLTRSGEKTYWDRSALYSMRGLFYCGEVQQGCKMLREYTSQRLLGCHPPYAVEAFPEGNSAQLSAESALYIRIFTEGILGYRPTGFKSFELKPNLPDDWDYVNFEKLEFFSKPFNISIRNGSKYLVTVNGKEAEISKGEKYTYNL